MKKLLFCTFLSFFFVCIYAQDNKPEANSFGIQYGVSYGGTLNQSLIFSGWLNKGIEVRGGLLVSFTQTDNRSGYNTTANNTDTTTINAYSSTENKSGSITLTPVFSVLKHFTTHSNIDPFVGVLVSTGVNMQTIQTQTINETTGDNYDRYSCNLNKTPVVITPGLSLVGGVNYFFAKNFAIGVDAGFGFTTAITTGKRFYTTINRNTGSNNPNSSNPYSTETTTTEYNNHVLTYTANLSGNGGLRFTYYIKVKKHAKNAQKS